MEMNILRDLVEEPPCTPCLSNSCRRKVAWWFESLSHGFALPLVSKLSGAFGVLMEHDVCQPFKEGELMPGEGKL